MTTNNLRIIEGLSMTDDLTPAKHYDVWEGEEWLFMSRSFTEAFNFCEEHRSGVTCSFYPIGTQEAWGVSQ